MSVPSTYREVDLNELPTDKVNLNYDDQKATYKIVSKKFSESDLKDGQVVVKPIYFSNDPAQRMWIQKPDPKSPSRSYMKGPEVGEPMPAIALGEVVVSKSSKYTVGDKVTAKLYWSEYCIVDEASIFNKIDESLGLPLTYYLSFLGLTGLTAYFGLLEVGKLQKGQTVVISAASGATGSTAVQIAKHLVGAGKVIGISGSDAKCEWVESLGADKCVNYNSPSFHDDLRAAIGKDFADVYFDNVGGEILDFMLKQVKDGGRVIACGAISTYNDPEKRKILNWSAIITQKLKVEGFIVLQFGAKFPDAIGVLSKGLKEGKIRSTEGINVVDITKELDVLAAVPKTWTLLFAPEKGNGKLITKVA
jgi:NADPH-dependent curcumin reductase CurA